MADTLVDVETVSKRLAEPDWLLIDCRASLGDALQGRRDWAQAHIPGALHADLETDLSGPTSMASGRHPLPSHEAWTATLSGWGITPETQVVAYDGNGGQFAARLWWMLHWAGHAHAAVLDGGLVAWQAAGLDLDTSARTRTPTCFQPAWHDDWLITTAGLQELLRGNCLLVDARAPERFAGQQEPVDPVAGHVPGAVNHFCNANLDPHGKFLPPGELRRRWSATLGGSEAGELVSMCGSGVTACHNLLAMAHAGLPRGRLYAGSWSEWIRDPSRAVATDPPR